MRHQSRVRTDWCISHRQRARSGFVRANEVGIRSHCLSHFIHQLTIYQMCIPGIGLNLWDKSLSCSEYWGPFGNQRNKHIAHKKTCESDCRVPQCSQVLSWAICIICSLFSHIFFSLARYYEEFVGGHCYPADIILEQLSLYISTPSSFQ